jgi:ribosomal protein S18 acetylase RimI-like enzyme
MEIQVLPEHLYGEAVALWERTGLTRPWNDADADLRRAIGGSSSTVFAGVRGRELLATAMVGHDGHRGWVYYLSVAPTAQGQGLGRLMMRRCEDWVRAQGIPKIQLMVRDGNASAVAFYRRLGYVDAHALVLGRRLDSGAFAENEAGRRP